MNKAPIFDLIKRWHEFAFENTDKIKTIHGSLYFYIIYLNNRLDWTTKFQLPSDKAMHYVGVKDYRTYSIALSNLVEWGFIEIITKSTNNYTATTISILLKVAIVINPKAIPSHTPKTPLHKQTNKTNKTFTPPTKDEVREYFKEKGYNDLTACKAYEYYNVADWIDSKGTPVKNWKQKMISNWMKPENKIGTFTTPANSTPNSYEQGKMVY